MLDPRTLGFQKLAALGALGVAGGLALILAAVFVFLHPYPRGGMDGTHYALTLMAFTGLLGVIIIVHVVFALQLWNGPVVARDPGARVARSKRKARS